MNNLIKYGSTENIPYYNCSGKSDEEWYATGQKRPLFGWTILIFGFFVEILYFPTIYLMFKTRLVRHSCYKIIVLLGIVDMLATTVSSFISGFLFIKGAVYCNYPTLIYVSGAVGFACWCSACGCTLCLVINRVGDVLFRPLCDFLFEGKRIFFSIFIITFYWFYVFMFTSPILFNSVWMAWISSPLVIENPTPEILHIYENTVQVTNNWVFVVGTCSLYTLYCILINKMQKGQKSKASKQVFIQSSVICSFNSFTAISYTVMLFIPTPPWVVGSAEFCWSIVHGAPAIIYLTMNKTIRHAFLQMLGIDKKKIGDSTTSNKQSKVASNSDNKL